MEICKKKIILHIIFILFLITFINSAYADLSFKKLENKKVSFLDFFFLKFENTLIRRSLILRREVVASRVQYSSINIKVKSDNKKEQIFISIYAIMDRNRYSRKKYKPKMRDCNQIRNLIFYQRHGYKFFTQKRDPSLSQGRMKDIFKEVFFDDMGFDEKEKEFLMNKMFVDVTMFHPIRNIELNCYGKVNDYVLK